MARARTFFAVRGGESGEVAEDHAGRPRGRAVAAGMARDGSFAAERDAECADSVVFHLTTFGSPRGTSEP